VEGVRSMIDGNARSRMRAPALLTALALALGAAACGDDDAESGDSSNAAQQAETRTFPDTPAGQVRETYATFVDTFYKRQPELVCESLTASARKELGKGHQGCEKRFDLYFGNTELGKHKPYIVKLKLKGRQASAMVKTKTSKQYPVTFAKENGEWKVSGGWGGGA
jgi:hypothetical protein